MKQKKVTVIISYDYPSTKTFSNEKIVERIKNTLERGGNPTHEKIESIKIEDNS